MIFCTQNLGYLWPTMIWGLMMMVTALVVFVMLRGFTFTSKYERFAKTVEHFVA